MGFILSFCIAPDCSHILNHGGDQLRVFLLSFSAGFGYHLAYHSGLSRLRPDWQIQMSIGSLGFISLLYRFIEPPRAPPGVRIIGASALPLRLLSQFRWKQAEVPGSLCVSFLSTGRPIDDGHVGLEVLTSLLF